MCISRWLCWWSPSTLAQGPQRCPEVGDWRSARRTHCPSAIPDVQPPGPQLPDLQHNALTQRRSVGSESVSGRSAAFRCLRCHRGRCEGGPRDGGLAAPECSVRTKQAAIGPVLPATAGGGPGELDGHLLAAGRSAVRVHPPCSARSAEVGGMGKGGLLAIPGPAVCAQDGGVGCMHLWCRPVRGR
jgi:hypothetical protein